MDFIVAVLVWFMVLLSPSFEPQMYDGFLPECIIYEDGSIICPTFELPAFDDVGL